MSEQVEQTNEFLCPFREKGARCPEFMCPTRPAPSNQEKKLFVMMGRDFAPTKKTCTRCPVFLDAWKKHIGVFGHFRYLMKWLRNKEIRNPQPQENL